MSKSMESRWLLCEVGEVYYTDGIYPIKPLQIFTSKIDAIIAKKYFAQTEEYLLRSEVLEVVHCDDLNKQVR